MFADQSALKTVDSPAFTTLSVKLDKTGRGRPLCVVSDSRFQLEPTGEQLATRFAADGWRVTLLDLSPHSVETPTEKGKKAKTTASPFVRVKLIAKHKANNWYMPTQAFCAYQWLRDKDFAAIVFHQTIGAGYYSCNARQLGLAFAATPLLVFADTVYARMLQQSATLPTRPRTDFETDFLERETVANADALLTTDPSCLTWLAAASWRLPQAAVIGGDKGQSLGAWLYQCVTKATPPRAAMPIKDVSIAVCLATANNSSYLRDALESYAAQKAKNFALIVVNHGALSPDVAAVKTQYAPLFKRKGWQWIELPSASRAEALDHGAGRTQGSHILFTIDEFVAQPDAIALYTRAAAQGADFLSAVPGRDPRSGLVNSIAHVPPRAGCRAANLAVSWLPTGANLPLNLIINTMGDENLLVRRAALPLLGTLREISGNRPFAWDQVLMPALAGGATLRVVPEILLCDRINERRGLSAAERLEKFQSNAELFSHMPQPVVKQLLLGFCAYYGNGETAARDMYYNRDNFSNLPPAAHHAKLFPTPKDALTTDTVKVVCCFGDDFITPTSVMMASLLNNAKAPVEIFAMTNASAENVAFLQSLVAQFSDRYPHKLHISPPPSLAHESIPQGDLFGIKSNNTYVRLFVPQIFPALKRYIYLDCDLIVRTDIATLWRMDLQGNILGAATEPLLYLNGDFGMENDFEYFNAGVLLVDAEKWRKRDITGKALGWIGDFIKNPRRYQYYDQTPLNRAIGKERLHLPPAWNMVEWASADYAQHYGLSFAAFEAIKKNPCIYHFAGHKKPWIDRWLDATPFAREYLVYQQWVDHIRARTPRPVQEPAQITVKKRKKAA